MIRMTLVLTFTMMLMVPGRSEECVCPASLAAGSAGTTAPVPEIAGVNDPMDTTERIRPAVAILRSKFASRVTQAVYAPLSKDEIDVTMPPESQALRL